MANERLRREIVEGTEALARIGILNGATMRDLRHELLAPPPALLAKDIRKLRERFDVSQGVFAVLLNVSISTVQKWEQGQKSPGASAARLLQVVNDYGLNILVSEKRKKGT